MKNDKGLSSLLLNHKSNFFSKQKFQVLTDSLAKCNNFYIHSQFLVFPKDITSKLVIPTFPPKWFGSADCDTLSIPLYTNSWSKPFSRHLLYLCPFPNVSKILYWIYVHNMYMYIMYSIGQVSILWYMYTKYEEKCKSK